jgi:hypothetical protein
MRMNYQEQIGNDFLKNETVKSKFARTHSCYFYLHF